MHFAEAAKFNCYDMTFLNHAIENAIGRRDTGLLLKYENYLVNVLTLYAGLCRKRNSKMMRALQDP
jgi:hypothetical protein